MKSTNICPVLRTLWLPTSGSDRSISGIGRSVEQGPQYLPNPVFFPRRLSFAVAVAVAVDIAIIAVVLAWSQ
ncbi:hypothetical protein C7T36_21745 [Rhodococcus sp. AD45-ID]|uniref:hypothetical protein n=1 Tax=unclassified Rhodococcus (in: high G+C Gram-positive bacteria) TaxID=192944 RepID=UPI0005D3E2F2|nr:MULTISPECIES: hypothetical protein [unclassified Rhodococcus (in: high G+C Gram-positive bacteria)]KJF22617.1 hypothetical protein SZ00_03271 [Rhodococcus sp. AD45]NRI64415.1 hypothetical protein [Rhodococcus sp. MS16]PSR40214.1 hypothetical protein C7T36_21745 [Rhodococcus sp. AD45-ID]